ncbi:MAG: hypothetical protein DI556_17645 [Rhodovulum sulfidophilum]|uniref:Ornithine cyclodeaminase n=1 Tax=Rhodovulum sulfidophilum TaxID=35806 RepID=A0A2W5N1M3_RHOSU|nr:MAG: hypothetical protein DI556_17645 [Rhodovulum sulfidophilum]
MTLAFRETAAAAALPPGRLLYLSRADLVALGLGMADVIAAVEDCLAAQHAGTTLMPGKASLPWKDGGRLNGNAAYLGDGGGLGIKWNAEVPANVAKGLPNLTALVLLNDPETGFPVAVIDGTWITAMRTGAASAVTAKHLAPERVEKLALIGCGVQMRTQLLGLLEVLSPETITIYDIRPEAATRFRDQMERRTGRAITIAPSAEAAVRDAGVVVSATKFAMLPDPCLRRDWIAPGALVMPIDVGTVWEPEAYLSADKFVTDRWDMLTWVAEGGHFPRGLPKLHAELHEIAAGARPGRERADEFIFSMNEGMPIEDMILGRLVATRAAAAGVGAWLDFLADPETNYDF